VEKMLQCWQECKSVPPFWETDWRFLKNLKIGLAYVLATLLLGICPMKSIYPRDICTSMFIAALFTTAKK
jgi:hypothetical protein